MVRNSKAQPSGLFKINADPNVVFFFFFFFFVFVCLCNKILVNGTQGCYYCTISKIGMINAAGYNVLRGSTITTNATRWNNTMKMNIDGDHTSSYRVYCSVGDTCTINCLSQDSCTYLYLYCYGECFVDCFEANNIHCPISSYGNYTIIMTNAHTVLPSHLSTKMPSQIPSQLPSSMPSLTPSSDPTITPSNNPTDSNSHTKEEFILNSNITYDELKSLSVNQDNTTFNPGYN